MHSEPITMPPEIDWFNIDSRKCVYGLSRRSSEWIGHHVHARYKAVRCMPNATLPLVVTAVHHSPGIDVLNWKTGKIVFRGNDKRSAGIFSPDGLRMITQRNTQLIAYETEHWNEIAKGPQAVNAQCAMSRCGRWIATQQRGPRGTLVMNSETFEPVLKFRGLQQDAESEVPFQAFDPAGKWFVMMRGQTVVGCWNLPALREQLEELGIEWPLANLGQGDASIPLNDVEIIWEPESDQTAEPKKT